MQTENVIESKVVTKTKHIKRKVVDNNTYKNATGVMKAEARKQIIDAIKDSDFKYDRILSLPADNCIIEKTLLDKVNNKIEFTLCERTATTFYKLLPKVKTLKSKMPIKLFNTSVKDIIVKANENEFTHLILDYCGTIGSFANEIKLAIDNNIVEVGGTISMTFCKRAPAGVSLDFINKWERLNPLTVPTEGCRIEPAIFTFLNRIGGEGYVVEKCFPYFDKSAMILFIIRRVK